MSETFTPYAVWQPPPLRAARPATPAPVLGDSGIVWQPSPAAKVDAREASIHLESSTTPARHETPVGDLDARHESAPLKIEAAKLVDSPCAELASIEASAAVAVPGALRGDCAAERRYRCVLADPAWAYKNWSESGEKKNANQHYGCMTVEQIAALPVADVLTEDAALFLWITGPFLMDAPKVATAWGFPNYSGVAFTWAKQSPNGKSWAFGPGYWTRKSSEFCLLFTRAKKPERRDRGVPELLVAPRREHSRKPDETHARIERLIDGPRLELFARAERSGWTALGNALTGNDLADDLRALALQPSLALETP